MPRFYPQLGTKNSQKIFRRRQLTKMLGKVQVEGENCDGWK